MPGKADEDGTKGVELVVQLRYLSNFWNAIEILLFSVNCEINLILPLSLNCFRPSSNAVNQATTFAITDTKLYLPVVTVSTDDNAKLH